jgi:YggT family protein
MLNEVIIPILLMLINIINTAVWVQFILSILISFNVVNFSNNFVQSLWQALNAILDPILNPIRRILPRMGMIDFSPLILLMLLKIVVLILVYIGNHYG